METHIDIVNAVSQMRRLQKGGLSYDEAWKKVTNAFKLTAKEMDSLSQVLKSKTN